MGISAVLCYSAAPATSPWTTSAPTTTSVLSLVDRRASAHMRLASCNTWPTVTRVMVRPSTQDQLWGRLIAIEVNLVWFEQQSETLLPTVRKILTYFTKEMHQILLFEKTGTSEWEFLPETIDQSSDYVIIKIYADQYSVILLKSYSKSETKWAV